MEKDAVEKATECPKCHVLVAIDDMEKYGKVICYQCEAMLEFTGSELIEVE